jgi:hypothetical protein
MNLEPMLAVWGGLYLDGEVISQADIGTYIEDVLNELEFLLVFLMFHISLKLFLTYIRVHQHRIGAALELHWVTLIRLPSTTSRLATKTSSTAAFPAMSVSFRTWKLV